MKKANSPREELLRELLVKWIDFAESNCVGAMDEPSELINETKELLLSLKSEEG